MSNIRDSLSERNIEINRPSTSQLPSSSTQPLRPKSSINKKVKHNKIISPSKKPLKDTPVTKQKQEDNISTGSLNSSSINDISTQYDNLNINDEIVDRGVNTVISKKKNRKKKDRRKMLQLQMPQENATIPHPIQTLQTGSHYLVQNEFSSLEELVMKQRSSLCTNTNTRYLENLSYHPQYIYTKGHIMEFMQNVPHPASVPNTPLLHSAQIGSVGLPNSLPNSALLHSEPTTPRYMENIMQHPLLSQTFSMEQFNNFDNRQRYTNTIPISEIQQNPFASALNIANNSQRRKKSDKKTEQKNDDKKFSIYMPEEEVNIGLKNNSLLEGILRINPKQFQHSYVSSSDRSEQDILIDGIKNRNRALEGDIVVVQIINDSDCEENSEDNKQKKGKVVYIKEKVHNRTCIGTLKLMADKNRQKALFVPRDHRVPRLNIPFTCWPDNFYQNAKSYENTLFLAEILDWSDTRFAIGKILCNIGQSGDMITETRAILAQTDLDITPYGPEVRHLYPRLDYTIPEDEIKIREDCRKMCIFSIDPFNCRDIDDAISCRELNNGNYEVGVHISDVAHFLTENTLLDEKVAEKATTIYLVEKAYHMLPDELCMLCSLFPGVDKLAFSVFWEMTKNAEVVSHRFSKTVIHSCCQLAYDHAQAILENKEDSEAIFPETYNGFTYQDIYKAIQMLGKFATILRKSRFENGALRIDQPKVAFHLNALNGLPETFWIYERKDSHELIEEFMLLANMTVAKRINDDHPKIAFLRCHPPPSGYMLKQLAKSLQPIGINLEISSAGDLHRSLMSYVGPDNTDKGKAMVLNMLCAKPMTRAKYFCAGVTDDEDFHHYALNIPIYTHFTSPIRRYADIVVHRLLAASLNYREVPNWEVDKIRMIAAQCNKQKYNAKKAGELSTELYTLKYIEMNSPLLTEAVVVEVREKYIDVIIVAMGLNRRIFFNNDFPGEYRCIKNDAGVKLSKMELTWRATNNLAEIKQIVEVFSILQVEMNKGDDMVKVEIKLTRPQ